MTFHLLPVLSGFDRRLPRQCIAVNLVPKTILIAEDDAKDVVLFQRAFAEARLPHDLKFVSSGLEVVDYLEGKAPYNDRQKFPIPDLLFLDLRMPKGGGINVLRWLQSNPFLRDLPVIVLTVCDQQEREAIDLGAKDYYVKPDSIADLATIFQNISQSWLS